MQFSNFLWIVPAVIYIFLIKRIFFAKNFMLFADLLPKNYFLNILLFLSLTGLFVWLWAIISRPYFSIYENQNNLQVVLALDSSISMNTNDILPSRIEVVKKWLENFLAKNISADIGVVIFAWKAYISLPPTDQNIVKNYVSNLKVFDESNQNLQWTAIWDAILASMKMLTTEKKAIVLITDGESNKWLSQKTAYQYGLWSWVDIFMIGVGSKNGGYLKVWDSVQKIDGVDLKDFEWKKFEVESTDQFETAIENIFSWYKNEKSLVLKKQFLDYKNIILFSAIGLLLVHLLSFSKFAKDEF